MSMQHYAVAIDGPSGAGKSTLAKAAAAELGILYVDTGAIYRTIACYIHRQGIDPQDEAAVIAALPEIRIEMRHSEDGLQHMILNEEDVTAAIRLPEISMVASAVSAIPAVRDHLTEMQRELARKYCVIMDGRDIGTVILPDAEVKIYLFADAAVRARRRMKELEERGTPQPFETVLREIEERDWADTHRAFRPLRPAEDAVMMDTGNLDFEESRQLLLKIIRGKVEA